MFICLLEHFCHSPSWQQFFFDNKVLQLRVSGKKLYLSRKFLRLPLLQDQVDLELVLSYHVTPVSQVSVVNEGPQLEHTSKDEVSLDARRDRRRLPRRPLCRVGGHPRLGGKNVQR